MDVIMRCFLADFRNKEVINISSGLRMGYVNDVEIDTESGQILSISVPAQSRYFGLFGREDDIVIPWDNITKIGEDIIFVELQGNRRIH